jgi:hypothetical protein
VKFVKAAAFGPRRVVVQDFAMADNNAFGSWRSTWEQYGPIVMAAAQVLHPLASADDLHALVVESAAQGSVDTERIDPLDALLAGLLHGRSQLERVAVARTLLTEGIDPLRATELTTCNVNQIGSATSPVRSFGSDASTPRPPEFDVVRTRALDFQTKSPGFSTDRLAKRREGLSTRDETVDDGAPHKRQRKRWPMLAAGFSAVCVVVAGSTFLAKDFLSNSTTEKDQVGFLIAPNIPKEWELVDAKAFVAFPSIGPTAVAQRFATADKTINILIGTNTDDSRYSDPSLGNKPPERNAPEMLRKDSKAQVMGTPGETQSQTKDKGLFKYWGERKTSSFMQSYGLSANDADAFANALTPRTNLAKDGWASPNAKFIETTFRPDLSASDRSGSTLEFRLRENHALRVIVASSKAIDAQMLDFYWGLGPNPITVTLPSGRVLNRLRDAPSSAYYWSDGTNSSFAQTGLLLDTAPPPIPTNQGLPQAFFRDGAPTKDTAAIEALLDALNNGNAKLWRRQLTKLRPETWTPELQASNTASVTTDDLRQQKLGVLPRTTLTIGSNRLELAGGAVHGKAVGLCTKTLCTRIYRDQASSTDSADVIIDGHWWHFENLATNEDEPTFRTSPAAADGGDTTVFPTADAALDKSYRWWGIDFGTKVQAARRNEQRDLFLRPVQ